MLKGIFLRPTAVGSMLLLGFLLWIGRSANAGAESFTLTDPDSFAPLLTLEQDANVIAGQYIVVLNENPVTSRRSPQARAEMVQSVAQTHVAATPTTTFNRALTGFAATLTEAEIAALRADARVAYIEPDQIMSIAVDQPNPTWGLDRIDQRTLPLDDNYRYDFDGTGVDLYVIDTGILSSHIDFGGRVVGGFNSTGGSTQNYEDCNGHGTHVAGTAGGTTYGVAKNVNLYAVRVLGCNGSGTNSGVIAGIDWVTANADGPSVANMSLGGPASTATDDAVRNSIAAGITYAVASGNDNRNACSFSPARVDEALTVNASTSADRRATFSNFGTCTDIFAPGQNITSAWYTGGTATNTISGTSMASPHVAGVAALYLSGNGNASPAEVKNGLEGLATAGEISNPGSGSPNLLLYSLVDGGNPLPTATPTATNTPLPSPTPLPGTLIFFDDFEGDTGWTLDPDGTDNATTGAWEVANPEETEVDGIKQLGNSFSGNQNLVTGAAAGTGAGSFDIDSGVTTIESTPIALPASGSLTLFFTYYFAHLDNGTAADFFRIALRNGSDQTTTPIFEELAQAENDDAAWESRSVDISDFAGQTVTVLISAADNGEGSLIEAGVDDLFITQEDDGGPPPTQIPTATPLPPTTTPLPSTMTPSPSPTLVNSPTPAPTATPQPVESEVYFDDFETDRGWTVDPDGVDNATTGIWEIGSPQATSNFGIKQLGTSLSGVQNLATGRLAGANAGTFDIDNGVVSIQSPAITLPQSNNLVLSFGYYLAHGSNATSDDYFRVAVVGATETVVFEELGSPDNDNAAWETTEVSLSRFAGQTINILISAADNGQPSLVEAAVDDLLISSDGAGSGSLPSPTPTTEPEPANLAPVIVDPGSTLLQTGQLAVLPLTVTDPEGDEISVDVLGLSQEFSFDPATNEIVGLPFATGNYELTIVATDSAGNRSELIFSLTVTSEQPAGRAFAPLYDDELSDAWSLSVWGTGDITTDNPVPVSAGEASLKIDLSGTLSSVAFEPIGPFDLAEFDYIQFDIHGIETEQAVRFAILDSQFQEIVGFSLSASNGEWRNVLVPISARAGSLADGVANIEDAAYILFRDQALAGTLYLDNVVLFQADAESQPPVQVENPLYLPIIAVPFDS